MKIFAIFVILLSFSGCSLLNASEPDDGNQKVLVFQDLLKQGWEIQIVDGKTVLVKQTDEGLLIQDVFGIMEDESDSLW